MSKTEYTDDWRLGLGMCVPSLRLPSIHEEGSGAGGSTAGGGGGGATAGGGSGGGTSTDRSGGLALGSSGREYGNSSRFGELSGTFVFSIHSKYTLICENIFIILCKLRDYNCFYVKI